MPVFPGIKTKRMTAQLLVSKSSLSVESATGNRHFRNLGIHQLQSYKYQHLS